MKTKTALMSLLAMEIPVIRHVEVTLFAYQMKNAFEEFVGLFATATMHVIVVIYVKIEYVNKVVAMTMLVIMIKPVWMDNAKILVKRVKVAEFVLNA
ncbi:unnamed protein product, partial [Iphiclides podalirius]